MREPPLDPIQPLKAASLRLNPPPEKAPPKEKVKRPPKVDSGIVIGMKAAGVPQTKIAEALNVSALHIGHVLDRTPDSREKIAEIREKLKVLKIEKANRVEGRMWERAEKEVEKGEAKDVDAMFRALLASEKIQAAVAGEGAASGAQGPPPAPMDLKVLIQQLIS